MKTRFLIATVAAVFSLSSFVIPQNGIDQVIGALRSGNVTELSKYIEDNIEITLPDKSDNYSKAQASLILKDFFANTIVKNFDVKHKGDGPNGQFCVGTLVTKNGNYRTNVFMKQKGNKEFVKEIRFQSVE
jgi:phosphoribosylformylglycinamidine (FGAM) synthase PurS component